MNRLQLLAFTLLFGCEREESNPPKQPQQATPSPPAETASPNPEITEDPCSRLKEKFEPFTVMNPGPPDAISMMVYHEAVTSHEGIDLLPIAGNTFELGSPEDEAGRDPDEGPQIQVKIHPFWISKFEISESIYQTYATTAEAKPTRAPATGMSHKEASRFCEWLSRKTGHYYRLPTEAEWEFACRSRTTTPFSFGADFTDGGNFAWSIENSSGTAQAIGSRNANSYGIHDMHGNVAEWCLDSYRERAYAEWDSKAEDPWTAGPSGSAHVVRGGSFHDEGPDFLRSAARAASIDSAAWIGFRIVRPLIIPDAEDIERHWRGE